MGISIRAYARQRGVSEAAVRKAIKVGRVTPLPDGTIDAARADRQWSGNTDPAKQRAAAKEVLPPVRESVGEAPASGAGTFQQARHANVVLDAKIKQVRLAKEKEELVDRANAIAHVFALARTERDAWLNWPARISAQLAADLKVDGHTLHVALEREVRSHLDELGVFQPRVN